MLASVKVAAACAPGLSYCCFSGLVFIKFCIRQLLVSIHAWQVLFSVCCVSSDQEQEKKQNEADQKLILDDPAKFMNSYRDALINDIGQASSTKERLALEDDQSELVKKLAEDRAVNVVNRCRF